MKKLLSLVLCACFFIETSPTCFASVPFLGVFDVFSYSVTSEGITITNIDPNTEGEVEIPNEIDGKPIISVNLYPALQYCSKITAISIPESVININGLNTEERNCYLLSEIVVDQSNPAFESKDGVLYTKGLNKLLLYPQGKPDVEFSIPNPVKSFDINAFINANNLKVINLSKSMEDPTALLPKSLSQLNVDEENIYFASVDGVLYSKNLKSLIYMPRDSTIKNFIFLNETEEIYPEAFMDCNIETVSLNDKIETIEMDSFKNCSFLKEIDLKNVKIIKENAFNGCSLLEKVYLCNDVQLIDDNAFDLTAFCFYMDGEPTAKGTYYSVENGKLIENNQQNYMLSFVVDGKIYEERIMREGELITFPAKPRKPGHTFKYWLPDNYEYMPNYDLFFYAVFENEQSENNQSSVEIIPSVPSDSSEPFIKFRTENEILELAWPALDQGFDLDYCGGGYDDAYIEYSTTGDIKINRNSNCTGEYLPYTDHTRIAIKSTIGIGGTITADLYSPDGELLASDTANVKVSPEWIVQLPLYLANAFATTGLAGIYIIGLPLLGVLLMPITILLGYIGFLF